MASILSDPNMMRYMGQMGLGLLAAGQAQPPGVNRYQGLMQSFNMANQGLLQSQLMDMKKEEYEEKKKDRMSQKSALSELVGGYDPKTEIDWESGRAGMTPGQAQQTMFRAFPEQSGAAMAQNMFPKGPEATAAVKDAIAIGLKPGTPEFTNYMRERTLPSRQMSQSMYKVQDESSPTGWSYADRLGNPSIKGAPPPGGQEITVDKDGNIRIGPMTGAQGGKRMQESLTKQDKSMESIAEIEAAMDRLDKVDYATGIPGYAIEEVGGLLEQLPFIGEGLAEGLGTKEVQRVRTQMQGLIGRMITPMTGEESGRYTEAERAIATQATKAKDPKASMQQITGALNSIREIELRAVARESMKQDSIPDLTSSIGRDMYVELLRRQYPNESHEELVDRLIEAMQKYRVYDSYQDYEPR